MQSEPAQLLQSVPCMQSQAAACIDAVRICRSSMCAKHANCRLCSAENKWVVQALHSILIAVTYCQACPLTCGFHTNEHKSMLCLAGLHLSCLHSRSCMHNVCTIQASIKVDALHRACCKLSSTSWLDSAPCKRRHGKIVWDQCRWEPARLPVIGSQGFV